MSIPSTSSAFVGRASELAHISALLSDPACRLLTLVGPGGIGKTRLALQAARQLAPPDAAYFVSLQPLAAPDFIISTIADAVGFQFVPGVDPKQKFLANLHEKSWLLVLDNFEHLLDGVPLLSEILAAAPAVRLLVTSRERLNLVEEWVLEVGGLAYPEDEGDTGAYSAVELFVEHARRVKAGFRLMERHYAAVVRICHLVNGMPLGIELAASWVRALSCEAIAEEIARSLDILETPARNVEPRHRTMRAAFEPTWKRLADDERDVFMRLSVFRGGFTREAAEQVAGAPLRTLSALLDKSLLRLDENGRYDLHELLRQYAADNLDAGETGATADRHFAYYLQLAEQAEAHAFGAEQLIWFDRLEDELDNLRAALAWSLELENGLRFAGALGWFFTERAHWNDGVSWLERALEANPDAPASLRAKALHTAAVLVWFIGANERARRYCEQSLALARATDDRWNEAWALSHLGSFLTPDLAEAVALQERSIALFRELGDAMGLAHTLNRRNWSAQAQNDFAYVEALLNETDEIARAAGDKVMRGWSSFARGQLFRRQGRDPGEARTLFEQSLILFQEAHFQIGVNNALVYLGHLELLMGNLLGAQKRHQEALYSLSRHEPRNPYLLDSLIALAGIASARGQFERAVRLFSVDYLFDQRPHRFLNFDAEVAALRGQLGEAAFAEAWAAGSLMTREQAIAYALEDVHAAETPAGVSVPDTPSLQNSAPLSLTAREMEILRLVAEGYANAEIAARLVLATSTVKWYVHSILDKLEASSRTQAVTRARALGLLD